jgi:hypothetical protein
MNEEHFYADVNLPFHVWVRERTGAKGYRWVLREASQARRGDDTPSASGLDRPPSSSAA